MKKKILIIAGEPNSINSEIIYKIWKKTHNNIKKRICLIGSYNLLNKQFKKLNYKIKLQQVSNIFEKTKRNELSIYNINLKFKNPFNVPLKESTKYVINSLNYGHKLACNKNVKGIINCPINKRALKESKKIGVTEFLAEKNMIKDNSEVMLIYNKKVSVSPITTHIDIKKVSNKIKKKLIVKKIKNLNVYFNKIFKKKPRIAILGLNPHNGELEKNSIEVKEIIPAISKLKKNGVNIKGPYVSDTIFIDNYKNFDVVIGMYHDQVLTPFKTLFRYDAINITLGLKYIRLSPDHGPAFDMMGKNKANSLSLFKCVKFINKFN
jgi:4-hydroxythreonine-4-phosphate dehydrogenase